jgi:hypothetical protein
MAALLTGGGREEVAGLCRHASTSAHTSTLPITHLDRGTDTTLPLIHLIKISGKIFQPLIAIGCSCL